ncbi:hypothetical protein BG011_003658 [Mortierella polycephala]|uniref:DNA2/NAM7 helicase-like C-terminal domain-containing protein n=1 Tax=Mortierella polycephala TaxID=41804 RepID=A0A9P6QDH8_9FUNG|nr:hypothetical protein BG011_003658 [Mortierella polycephala]
MTHEDVADASTASEILDLLQKLSLRQDDATEGQASRQQTTSSLNLDSNVEYSFSSLEVSTEEWAAIDNDTFRPSSPSNQHEHEKEQKQQQNTARVRAVHASTTASVSTSISQPISHPSPDDHLVPITGPVTTPRKIQSVTKDVSQSESTTAQKKYRFSPSVLAHHANMACEKMLHLKGQQLWQKSQEQGTASEKEPHNKEPATAVEAAMARGLEFERCVQTSIQDKIDCEAEGDKDSFFRLATTPEGTMLCQPTFSLDGSFYTEAMDKAGIVFGRFIPDFIKILPSSDGSNKKRLFIIDAKSSSHVKVSHHFQVILYAIFLDHLIKVNKMNHLIEVDHQGGVWTPGHTEPKTFSLVFMRPIVENFIFKEFPSILMKPLESAIWHIDSPCDQCEFLPSCKTDAKEQMTLSLIPLLSKKSALWFKSLIQPSPGHQSEIEDLEDLVRDRSRLSPVDKMRLEKVLRMDSDGNSPTMAAYRESALKASIIPIRTMELPSNYQARLLINIVIDPVTLLPIVYSLDSYKDQQTYPSRSVANVAHYFRMNSPDRKSDQVRLTHELIDALHECLVQLSQIRPRPPVISIFFYNRAMQNSLSTLLLRVIGSESGSQKSEWTSVTKARAMDLLANMFEDPSFLTLSETAGANIKLPDLLQLTQGYKNVYPLHDKRVFSIEPALHILLALPTIGTYTFKDMMTLLVDVEAPAIIEDKDRNDEGYNQDAIYSSWSNGCSQAEIKTQVRNWANQQNVILIALYGLIRKECGDLSNVLLAPQAPFKMRCHINIQHNILQQFVFFFQWEAITQVTRRRQRRIVMTKDESSRFQHTFQCRFVGRHFEPLPGHPLSTYAARGPSNTAWSVYVAKFEVTSRLDPGVLTYSDYKNWILSPDTPSGLRARMRFDDMALYLKQYNKGIPSIVSVSYYDVESNILYLTGSYYNMVEELALKEGEHYILERRENGTTLMNSMIKLIQMDENDRLFLILMADPNKWGQQRPEGSAEIFVESFTNPARRYDMTLSQEQAFTKIVNNQLQIIWGPPGSGKTHFLALTVLRFVDILRSLSEKGKGRGPQTVVLTAFTHAAINNLVMKIVKLHAEIAPHAGYESIIRPLVLYRLGTPSTVQLEGVHVVEPHDLTKLQRRVEGDGNEDVVRVICGTVWAIRRVARPDAGADYMKNVQMLMIDEASQMLAADSIHAIECLDPKHGRLVVAGDHLQLGPVIMGDYPASERAMDPTGSIMKNLMRKSDNTAMSAQWTGANMDVGPCTSQLEDNFRMNFQLGTFMKSIYGPKYQIRNPKRTLPYSGALRGMSFPAEIRQVLDPERSAICIELQLTEDKQCREAVMVRNEVRLAVNVEAAFVAGIVEYYLEMVGQNTVTSLYIVVPHHVQRLAILNKVNLTQLQGQYPLAEIKIDTIEKIQGQEADFVIVCFGIFDDFTLLSEQEFVYSVHRWVVALSRARCKSVLFMTPELRTPKIIGGTRRSRPTDQKTMDGWGLLQAYEKYSESLGGKMVWPINEMLLKSLGI